MRKVLKWVLGGLAAIVVLAVIGIAVIYAALSSTVPSDDGDAVLAGLGAPVRVVQDAHGIPHIEAQDRDDALRALGYLHARDRLWQMHVLRMVAQGRLSEMFGSATIDTDVFLKTVDLAGAAKASFNALSPDAQAALTAYAEGVNAFLNRKPGILEASLPPEFLILGVTPEPWKPWQSQAIVKVMALTLDSNLDTEITRFALAARGFNNAEIEDLLPYDDRDSPPPMPDLRRIYEFPKRTGLLDPGARLAWETGITASNSWVVAGERTVTGKPLLANDPHLGLQSPTVFYLAHLSYEQDGQPLNVIGGTLPGTPLLLLGRNDRIAWGLTTTTLDSQDLFVEKVNPADPNQYMTPDGWRDFEVEEVEVGVKDGDPVKFTRRVTRHGPVLPDGYRGLGELLPVGHVGALQWVSLATDDTTAQGALDIMAADSVDAFLEATRHVVAPMQTMVVGDVDGNIAVISPGRVPVRNPANQIAGRAPVPGWLGLYDWQGYLPTDELPKIVNPADGALATANGKWIPRDYPHMISYDWDEPYRQRRVEQLVKGSTEKHSPATMQAIQADSYSPALIAFRDQALTQLDAGAGVDADMLDALAKWDGRMEMDQPEPLILTAWWRHFNEAMLKDDLGSDFSRFAKGNIEPLINILSGRQNRNWCDNRQTAAVESCGKTLAVALAAANAELNAMQGGTWQDWRWGKAHLAFGEHRPFSSVKPLAGLFTVEPESGGGPYTLLRGRPDFREKNPYYSVHASAYRGWYDFSDLDKSQFVTSTGQSGHFLSPHYDDLAPLWAKVDYVSIPSKRADYEANAAGIWNLTPAN